MSPPPGLDYEAKFFYFHLIMLKLNGYQEVCTDYEVAVLKVNRGCEGYVGVIGPHKQKKLISSGMLCHNGLNLGGIDLLNIQS